MVRADHATPALAETQKAPNTTASAALTARAEKPCPGYLDSPGDACYHIHPVGGITFKIKIDYNKLRDLDTAPLLEFEQQIAEKQQREIEAKKRGDDKKKGKRGRR